MKRVVLITGCSSGIGLASALALAARGWTVVSTVRGAEGRDALQAAGATVQTLDVTDLPATERVVARVLATVGRLDAVVANAGRGLLGCFEDLDPDQVEGVFAVNVHGAMNTVRAALPALRASRGRAVLISSVAGLRAAPGSSAYNASKFAIEGLGEALRFELAPLGVTVVLVEPGATDTGFWSARWKGPRVGSGPYAAISARLAVIQGKTADASDPPSLVADAVILGLEAQHPPLRLVTGRSAQLQVLARRLLPWRLYERLVRRTLALPEG